MAASGIIGSIYIPALLTALLRSKIPPLKETTTVLNEYDYIIVGSGPGGSIVANRLSEDPKVNVLILEAGAKDNVSTEVPTMTIGLLGSDYDWLYKSEPQEKFCLGMKSKECSVSAGKVIGGSSSLGLMLHERGFKLNYEEWAEDGNTGWSYEEVLPYFKKYENYTIDGSCVESKYHGCSGELPISSLPSSAERKTTDYFVKGAEELGYKKLEHNDESEIGVARGHYTLKNGGRVSAATAFLRTAQDRPNLHIVVEAFVRKILIDPEKKSVTGVEFEKDGVIKQVNAKKEVILSAGTYSSPKILMLSGIGPKDELEKFKIPVIVDLPGVGQNLQELVAIPIMTNTGNPLPEGEMNIIDPTVIRGWLKGTGGLMASPSGMESYIYVKSKYETKQKSDLAILGMSMPLYGVLQTYLQTAFGFSDEIWNDQFTMFADKEVFTMLPTILNPRSRGKISLKSSDPNDRPILHPNILDDELDRKVLIEGVRLVQKLLNTTLFAEKGFKMPSNPLQGCAEHELYSDEYILCEMKYMATIIWCGCCTNKMGPDSDKMAVLDNRLRVKGVTGIRVVDLSVFPTTVAAVPAATVYMAGEKAAAMIKEDNKK